MRKTINKSITSIEGLTEQFESHLRANEKAVYTRCAASADPRFGSPMDSDHDVTRLLTDWANGDAQALNELTPLVYKELHQIAASYLRKERYPHTLQPTALVHETYLRLVDQAHPDWQSRFHFYGVAARLMRQILVDHARQRKSGKRTGVRVPLEEAVRFETRGSFDLVALNFGLTALERFDPRKSKVVELRYFGGLSMDEIARAMSVSPVTVRRDLRLAEAWLHKEMERA